jgi:glucose/arabinose dehydrogenase
VLRRTLPLLVATVLLVVQAGSAWAQAPPPPSMTDPGLGVRTVTEGLTTPSGVAFLGPNDMLVTERETGQVKRVVDGQVTDTVLDLAVNFASERGLLSIALDPDFPEDPGVYLFWSCRTPAPPADPFTPELRTCDESAMLGEDTEDVLSVPLLGNRVDRFEWNPETGTLDFDRNLISVRSFQSDGGPVPAGQGDEGQEPRGNHDGGVIRFGPDGKLYVILGDTGRRGLLQNLPCGPVLDCPDSFMQDDQFGGPEPDDAHLTGAILRLDENGEAPRSNPFYRLGARLGDEAGDNIQKLFAVGIRNSFGMAFDPKTGDLWEQENSDDAFDEINRVTPGMNSGWIQIMGPDERIEQFREIETTLADPPDPPDLQQLRWPPTNIATSLREARERLRLGLRRSRFSDPEFSWKFAVPPAAIGFVDGQGLGAEFDGDLFVGAATPATEGGHLFRFDLTRNRRGFDFSDPRLADRVADNAEKDDITESESLLVGRNFGITTDIQTAPNGNLYIVSTLNGAIYEIFRQQ